MPAFHLVLLIHSHQPVGNFDHVLESSYRHAYLPFVETLARHPRVRLGLHYTGPLLEWIESHHPEYFDFLRELVGRGQVELVGGGFYEPILAVIPPEDRLEQIRTLAAFLEKHFGRRPTGAWLAERVWEPQLPATLRKAGVDYTLVDDTHFIAAGFDESQLHGHYIAEDLGSSVNLLPGLTRLRYLIPFGSVQDTIAALRSAAAANPAGIAVMGDDLEKFGVWPETFAHCYTNGWLDQFFSALDQNADWLATQPPSEAIASRCALGRADLPTASYPEMMEWALPTAAREKFHFLHREFDSRPEVTRFLRGGIWRAFFSKYSEANLLHKKMLHVSSKVARLARKASTDARTHLLRSQCNDAYWHGIFGGTYAPHLRTAIWREMIRAEELAERASVRPGRVVLKHLDFDADGNEDLYVTSPQMALLVKPSDGGTVAALDFRPSAVTLINSMQRRPEAYHSRLLAATHATASAGGPVSIHDQVRSKEPGLERLLQYDRWPRHSFRLLVFSPHKSFDDYRQIRIEEDAAIAASPFAVVSASTTQIILRRAVDSLHVTRAFSWREGNDGLELHCSFSIEWHGANTFDAQVGLEVIVNLLAPDAPDRRIEFAAERHPLRWAGIAPSGHPVLLTDEWQNVAVALNSPNTRETWIAPVETVSESEEGFERVYQGSQLFPVWSVKLQPAESFEAAVTLTVRRHH